MLCAGGFLPRRRNSSHGIFRPGKYRRVRQTSPPDTAGNRLRKTIRNISIFLNRFEQSQARAAKNPGAVKTIQAIPLPPCAGYKNNLICFISFYLQYYNYNSIYHTTIIPRFTAPQPCQDLLLHSHTRIYHFTAIPLFIALLSYQHGQDFFSGRGSRYGLSLFSLLRFRRSFS